MNPKRISIKTFVAIAFASFILVSCGGKEKSKTADVSAPMQSFMKKLDGSSAHTTAALTEFGKPELETDGMEMYDLKNPEVVETNGNCYLLECKSGMTKRKYNICWEADKISSVQDRGME